MSSPVPDRPDRPAYGEYATPEEQRARIQQPDATAALSSGQSVEATTPSPPPPPEAPASVLPPSDPAAPARRPRTLDRIATFGLLGYGLFNVLTSIPAFTEYSTYANTLLGVMGVDAQFTGGGRGWGLAAALVLGLGWLLTATVTWQNLRRGRITWWIPLVGGVVFTLTASVLLMVPLLTDPTIWSALVGAVG